ncbi:hypothetical protein HU200_055595 [Digitaria exilis]|uniref:Uncharacterized protein n=1 Tax=Digitaria exilis TaxID=1010633 RepID=A0A835AKB0_9POAL|nr:hypothetical protein HU200_055595 [Digitaria exilis]
MDELIEGHGTDTLTDSANAGGLFSTGDRAVRRARVLVGGEVETTDSNKKRSKSFGA